MINNRTAWAVLILLVGSFFVSKWVVDGALFTGDMVSFTAPFEHLMGRWQAQGAVPIWVPEIQGGYPLLANGNISFWYLPHILLRLLLPGPLLMNASLLLHALLGAAGMYLWLRHNRFAPIIGVTIGLLYVFGGAMGARLALSNFYTAMAWVPLLVYLLQRFVAIREPRILFWWTLASIMHVFSGNPQAVVLGLIIEMVFLGVLLWEQRTIRPLLFLAGAGILIVLLTSVHTLPLLDHLPQSDRSGGVTVAELFEFNFPPEAWRGLVQAHPFGHQETYIGPKGEAEIAAYLGPAAVVLILAGALGRKGLSLALMLGVGILIAVGTALSLGEISPLYRWAITYTPLRFFANPARYFLFVHVGLVVLAASGMKYLLERIPTRWHQVLTIIIALGTVVPVMAIAWTWEPGIPWTQVGTPRLVSALVAEGTEQRTVLLKGLIDPAPDNNFGITVWHPVRDGVGLQQAFQAPYEDLRYLRLRLAPPSDMHEGEITVKLLDPMGGLVHQTTLSNREIVEGEWTVIELPTLLDMRNKPLVLELTSRLSAQQAPRVYIHTKGDYDPTGELSLCRETCNQVLTDGKTTDLAFSVLPAAEWERPAHQLLGPNVAAGYGISSADWTGSLGVATAVEYRSVINEGRESLTSERGLLNRMAITTIVTAGPPHRDIGKTEGIAPVHTELLGPLQLHLYKNEQAFPRIHFATRVLAASTASEQLSATRKLPAADPNIVVADIAADESFVPNGQMIVVRDEAREVIVQTDHEAASFLVFRDVFYPGWHVFIDGQETILQRVDTLFRGVKIPAGYHEVRFQYQPSWLMPAVWLTVLGSIGVLVWGLRLFVSARLR